MRDQGELEVLLAAVTAGTLLAGFLSSRLHQRVDRIVTRTSDVSALLQQRAEDGRPISRPELRDVVTPLVSPLGRDRLTPITTGGIFVMFLVCIAVIIFTVCSTESRPTLATIMITLIFLVVVFVSVIDSGSIAHLIKKQEDRVLVRYFAVADLGLRSEKEGWVLPFLHWVYCPRSCKHTKKTVRLLKDPDLDNAEAWRFVERTCRDAFRAQPALLSACVGALVAGRIAHLAEQPDKPYPSRKEQHELLILAAPLVEFFLQDPPSTPGGRRLWFTAGFALSLAPLLASVEEVDHSVPQLKVYDWAKRILEFDAGPKLGSPHRDPASMTIVSLRLAIGIRRADPKCLNAQNREIPETENEKTGRELFERALEELRNIEFSGPLHGDGSKWDATVPEKAARAVAAMTGPGHHGWGDMYGDNRPSPLLRKWPAPLEWDLSSTEWLPRPLSAYPLLKSLRLATRDSKVSWRDLVARTRYVDEDEEHVAGYSIDALIMLLLLHECGDAHRYWLTGPVAKILNPDPLEQEAWQKTAPPEEIGRIQHAQRITRPGNKTDHADDRYVTGLLPLGSWLQWFNAADLPATWVRCFIDSNAVTAWKPPVERAPSWQPDPSIAFEYRYFDGKRWTEHAMRDQALIFDAVEPSEARWAPDPSGKHHARFFDGCAWTAHVYQLGDDGRATYAMDDDPDIVGTQESITPAPPADSPLWASDPAHQKDFRYHDGHQWTPRYAIEGDWSWTLGVDTPEKWAVYSQYIDTAGPPRPIRPLST